MLLYGLLFSINAALWFIILGVPDQSNDHPSHAGTQDSQVDPSVIQKAKS